jgi:hypothetical protein
MTFKEILKEKKEELTEKVEEFLSSEETEEILKRELSAAENIDRACEEIKDEPMRSRLLSVKADHNSAIIFWQKQLKKEVNKTEVGPDLWAEASKAFVGASKIAGNVGVMKALEVSEQYGLSHYQNLLKSEKVSSFQKTQIRSKFIPNQKRHIGTLKAMINTA